MERLNGKDINLLENRKILTATIGYIIGIIVGLYCKISIALIYLIILLIYLIFSTERKNKKFKLISFKRYFRYIKIIFTKKVIKIIIIFSIISNSIFLFENYKFENLYKNLDGQNINISGIIVQKSNEKYKIKVKTGKLKNTYLYFYLNSKQESNIDYGDEITLQGTFSKPSERTNYKGYDYKEFLKTLKVYGNIKAKQVKVISKNNLNFLLNFTNKLNLKIQERIEKSNLSTDEKGVLTALIVGDKDTLDDEIVKDFSKANISHILAISGMHISYIILFTNFIFNKLIGKHYSKPATSIIIFVYMGITGFSPPVVRAGITGITLILSNFFYRKNDTWESISFSLLIQLIYNPYLLKSLGLQLSFLGVIRNNNISK